MADTNRPLATYPPVQQPSSRASSAEPCLRPASHPAPAHARHADNNNSYNNSSNGAGPQQHRGAGQGSGEEVRARLVLDCMGHWSPIVKQMRGVQRPDGMCLVVGGCASGFTPETNKCARLPPSLLGMPCINTCCSTLQAPCCVGLCKTAVGACVFHSCHVQCLPPASQDDAGQQERPPGDGWSH